jgi:hypothetical protein
VSEEDRKAIEDRRRELRARHSERLKALRDTTEALEKHNDNLESRIEEDRWNHSKRRYSVPPPSR